ncbi:MAG TPA: helix-turn-helix domain-containing protein, partial [Dermatophilaceae bacterium]
PGSPLGPALDAAYGLGRGEARSGRSMDALLAAYRVGARVAWRELAGTAVRVDLPAQMMAQFAELVFAYIDELSAASVSGHSYELAAASQTRQRYLDRLARSLLLGESADTLLGAAERAEWTPPHTLTAVLLPDAQVRGLRSAFDVNLLVLHDDLPDIPADDDTVVLLVPNMGGRSRTRLRDLVNGRYATLGPARPWMQADASYRRALRTRALGPRRADVVDSDEHLVQLVLTADPEAVADLRTQILAPLSTIRSSTADKLKETLRMWALHHGHRDAMAAALFVHPQTVRYRMTQLRELYGNRMEDPATVLAITVALGATEPST